MSKKGFHFNQSLCSGCRSCMLVCKENHHLPEGVFFRRVQSFIGGDDSKLGSFHLSLACNHCMDPACVKNCPTGATYVDEEDGTVQHDDSLCIACQSCVNSCPYSAPQYIAELNIAQKCDACYDLRALGEEPDCVKACLMRALTFGDVDDGGTNLSELACAPASDTNPCTFVDENVYERSGKFQEWIL